MYHNAAVDVFSKSIMSILINGHKPKLSITTSDIT